MNLIKNWLDKSTKKFKLWFLSLFKNNNNLILKYKKLDSKSITPTKAHDDDAGLDLYALEKTYIPAGQWRSVRTGLAFEILKGWCMQIHTRSSYAKLKVRNHLGIIDSGYRNEVLVIVYNDGYNDFIVEAGSKFCQVLILPTPFVTLVESNELSNSNRGQGGFGSSGK